MIDMWCEDMLSGALTVVNKQNHEISLTCQEKKVEHT